MAVRDVVLDGDPVLRRRARPVRRYGDRLRALVSDMFETMDTANGLGLAAPQVGRGERVVVVQIPDDYEDDPHAGTRLALCNPEIVRARGEELGQEGCLSVPRFYGEVRRAEQVTVKGLDPHGTEIRIKAEGLLARVLQHELDHLDGILFLDKVEEGILEYIGEGDLEELASEPAPSGMALEG